MKKNQNKEEQILIPLPPHLQGLKAPKELFQKKLTSTENFMALPFHKKEVRLME